VCSSDLETASAEAPSCIAWDGAHFSVVPGRERHPMSTVRWLGAAAYCNWYSVRLGLALCYSLPAGAVDWTKTCVRLPTEAEWEYAAWGGLTDPYAAYPWGDETDPARVNWVTSGDPWEQGPEPASTPAAFYDGSLRHKTDFGWPAAVESYQTLDGKNGYGLYDVAGNVWEWVNDWYARDYYAVSPGQDPKGPEAGDLMPDGLPYRGIRGGSFFNMTKTPGDHERVSNRDPAYFRGKYLGKDDPDGPYFHIGFRIALQQR
jgi:formylglycine-generating enzyme required for sulfatase activity